MPYAPTERLDTSSLANGISQGGLAIAQAIQSVQKNQQQMQGLEGAMGIMAQQYPDVVTPELLEKFSKAGLGQRQGMVGQISAEILNKFKSQQIGMEQQRIDQDWSGQAQRDQMQKRDLAQRNREISARSQYRQDIAPDGTTIMTNKGTGNAIKIEPPKADQPIEEVPLPISGGSMVKTPDGKWHDRRPDPFGAFGASSYPQTPGVPAGPQGRPQPTPPPQGGPRQIRTPQEYQALPSGTKYLDPNGVLRTKR